MNTYDIVGWALNGAIYCPECKPEIDSEELNPIFAGSEWDFRPACHACHEPLEVASLSEVYGEDTAKAVAKILETIGLEDDWRGDEKIVCVNRGYCFELNFGNESVKDAAKRIAIEYLQVMHGAFWGN